MSACVAAKPRSTFRDYETFRGDKVEAELAYFGAECSMDNATTLVQREASEGEPSSHTHLPGFEYPGEQGV